MASTYSPSLKVQLMATGENSTTWGSVTNTNLGTALEEAITGSVDVTFASGNVTLTLTDSNASQSARNLRLNLTGTTAGARNLIVPSIEKVYIVNNGCADAITVKNSTGTGIAVPAGKTMWVFNDATNVVDVVTNLSSLTLATALPVASGGTGVNTSTGSGNVVLSTSPTLVTPILGTPTSGTLTNCTGLPLTTGITGTLAVANGGTGVTTSTGSGANVLGTSPVLVTPNIGVPSFGTLTNCTGLPLTTGVTGTLAVASGGTGQTTYTNGQLLIGNTTGNTLTKGTLTAGSGITVTNGGGTITISASGSGGTVTSVNVDGSTTGLTFTGGPITSSGTFTVAGTLAVANGGTGTTSSTGSGAVVKATSPTLVTPVLGTPASGTLTNCTGLPLTSGVTGTLAVASGGTGQTTYTDGQLLIGNSTGNTLTKATLTAGSGVTITNGNGSITISSTASGSGTVTSVAGSGGTTGMSFTGGPVTTAGTLTLTGTLAVANGGTGITTVPTNGQIPIGNGTNYTAATLTAGTGISITNASGAVTISSTATSGTVTSVSGSGGTTGLTLNGGPITSSGTLTLGGTLAVANGGTGSATGDASSLNNLNASAISSGTTPIAHGGTGNTSYTDGQLLIGNTTGNTLVKSTLTAGSGVTITNGGGAITISATGSGGTVSSVALALPSIFSVSGSPITSAGTLTGTLASQTQNLVFASPNGASGTPTFRALVAADIPTLNQNTTGTAATVTGATQSAITSAPNLSTVGTVTSGTWSASTVAVNKGGTGQTSYTDGQILVGNTSTGGLDKATITAGSGISVTNGNGSITIANTYTGSAAQNGYTYLPNGLLMQWGYTATTTATTISFPIAFPTACFSVTASKRTSGTTNDAMNIQGAPSTSSFTVATSGTLMVGVYWFAIGN